MNACKSQDEKQGVGEYSQYEAVSLGYKIIYPSDWFLFESSETLLLSSKKEVLIMPESEQLQQENEFALRIYVVEDVNVVELLELIENNNLFETKHEEFDSDNNFILFDYISEDAIPKMKGLYEIIFGEELSSKAQFFHWKRGVIISNIVDEEKAIKKFDIIETLDNGLVNLGELKYNKSLDSDKIIQDSVKVVESVEILDNE